MIAALLSAIVVSTNAVSFSARATGIPVESQLEFVFVDPTSDRDYEALYVTDDPIADIVAALDAAGIPKGRAYDANACVFYPEGKLLTLSPDLGSCIADEEKRPTLPIVYTGGTGRLAEMPATLFALYSLGSSPLQLDDILDQGAVYGRFRAAKVFEKGEKRTFTLKWDGVAETTARTPDFPGEKTVREAVKVAQALAQLDSREAKINAFKPGQFYYRAFLPLTKWRDRTERLAQPLEVRLGATNTVYTVIDEDWSVPGDDPKLTERDVSAAEAAKFTGTTCFIYARADERLARLYDVKAALPTNIVNWYVYGD